jgi:hypothetical protein
VIAGAAVRLRLAGTPDSSDLTAVTDDLGSAPFAGLPAGRASLEVVAEGFAPKRQNLEIRAGTNQVRVKLEIAARKDAVAVAEDEQEARTNPRGPGLSGGSLTPREIAELPDDPEEMQQVLEAMAGPGSTIRVDGFRGGRLPHKSQIQSIQFRLTPYSAEEHDDSFNLIDIVTKPGLGIWHGSLTFAAGDEALNARNSFAPVREPQQARRVEFTLAGPLLAGRTSASVWFSRNTGYDSRSARAATLEGLYSGLVRLPSASTDAEARLQHALPKMHLLRLEYQAASQDRSDLGPTDLPERLSSTSLDQHVMRISESGALAGRLLHELRFQLQWIASAAGSSSSQPAVLVQGAFGSGGAGKDSNRSERIMDLTEQISYSRGRHNLRSGFQVDGAFYDSRDLTNANGTFVFPSLDAYRAAQPATYSRRRGDVRVHYSQFQSGAFIQDDIRLRKNLSASLGVRYETQSNLAARWNFAPRGGISWSPFRGGRTTVRAGGGVYFQWFDAATYEQVLRVNGSSQLDQVIRQPGFPDPLAGGGAALDVLPPSIVTRDPNLTLPYVLRGSVSLQQQVGKRWMLMTDVRGQRGVHQLRSRNLNAPVPGIGRPDRSAGNSMEIQSNAGSFMRGVGIHFSPMPSPGGRSRLFWLVNYTFSRTENETDGTLAAPSNNLDLRAGRGPALSDARHRLGLLTQLRLPKGVRLGTFLRARSGLPYNVTTGFDDNGDTVLNDRPPGLGRNSARGSAQWDMSLRASWTRGIGRARTEGTMPRQVRVVLNGEGGGVPDLPGGEGAQSLFEYQLYAQAYNVINHANLTNFVGVLASPLFGQPTAAAAGRRVELGIKVSF